MAVESQSIEDWRCDGELRQLKVDPSTMTMEDDLLYKSSELRISLLYHSLCVHSFEDWRCEWELRQLKVDRSTMTVEEALLYKSSELRISLLYHSLCVQSFEDWRCGGNGSLRWTLENDYRGCCAIQTFRKAQELCESRGGRPGLPSLISLRFLWT